MLLRILRLLDLGFSLIGIVLLSPILMITFVVLLSESNSPIFRQRRVGLKKQVFIIYKFRTMAVDTQDLPSHEVSAQNITAVGKFLRKYKIDELPQLFNVVKGEMSLVGPRPCLDSQIELIRERDRLGVFDVLPGISGRSQVGNIDMSLAKHLAESDANMISKYSIKIYFVIIFNTIFKVAKQVTSK